MRVPYHWTITFMGAEVRAVISRFIADKRGHFAVITGMLLTPLAIGMALGSEFSRAVNFQAEMQNAVDSAVLAAVVHSPDLAERKAYAQKYIEQNISQDYFETSIQPTYPTTTDGSFAMSVNLSLPVMFGQVLGYPNVPVNAKAAAIPGVSPGPPICMLIKQPNGESMKVNSGAKLKMTGCELQVASTGTNAFIGNNGGHYNADRICVAGTSIDRGSSSTKPTDGCATTPDPFAGLITTPPNPTTCDFNNVVIQSSGKKTIQIGKTTGTTVWCGNINFQGNGNLTYNFQPGLHICKDCKFNVNSNIDITGNEVAFYFMGTNAGWTWNGNSGFDLRADGDGDKTGAQFAGILMYAAATVGNSAFHLNAGSKGYSEGLIYLPNHSLFIKGKTQSGGAKNTIVVRDTILDNGSDLEFQAYPGRTFYATGGTAGPPRLLY
jgi:hypothetical protein